MSYNVCLIPDTASCEAAGNMQIRSTCKLSVFMICGLINSLSRVFKCIPKLNICVQLYIVTSVCSSQIELGV